MMSHPEPESRDCDDCSSNELQPDGVRPTLLDRDWQGAIRTLAKADLEPTSFFITFTCYGTWLHGDQRGSVDPSHNEWQSPRLEPDEERERCEFQRLKHAPVHLGPVQRSIVHRSIEEVVFHRGWRLHALNVRTNHVHVVVTANRAGKRIRNDFKSYATRHLKEANYLPAACLQVLDAQAGTDPTSENSRLRVWTRGGSLRRIDSENSFQRAIEYTLFEQGPDITFPAEA
jgi:REP element-mobilizing transposase RayT